MKQEFTQSRIQTICLVVIATSAVTYMIYWLRPVLVPFVVALFIVSGIMPLLQMLEKRLRVNRIVAAGISFLLGLGVLFVAGLCLWLSVLEMTDRGQAYRERVGELIAKAAAQFDPDSTKPKSGESGISKTDNDASDPGLMPLNGHTQNTVKGDGDTKIQQFRNSLDTFLRDGVARLSAELFSLLSTSIVVLIYVFFLLAGVGNAPIKKRAFREIDSQVRSYLSLKTTISVFTGAAFGLVLWLFGVPMALTFGVLAFLLNYIPNVGPIVASVLPIPFILLEPSGSAGWMVAAIVSTCGIQLISGNVVEPRIMGRSSDLHPVVILLALMFWGMMWGITGMFLATPITAALRIVLQGIEPAKPIADLLAGRWGEEQGA
jgi:AI-2 transport protein TqsA